MITINYDKIKQHQQDLQNEAKKDRMVANCKGQKSNLKVRVGRIVEILRIN
ncbi:MAG: hypothetical protein WBB69_05145 [Anaerolineales bacterium]